MAFSVERLDHVVITTPDVEATVAWYVRVLGMRRESYGSGRTALHFGDQKFNVRPTGQADWETARVDAPGSLDLCFVADATPDEVAAHLAAVGEPVHEGPVVRGGALGDITSHYVVDPDGNLVEIASYA